MQKKRKRKPKAPQPKVAQSSLQPHLAQPSLKIEGLPVLRPNVAGMDVASEEHWICAPTVDGSGREVACFGATTAGLEKMAEWLKVRGVGAIAMESTGVIWIPPFEFLEAQGFEVILVDARKLMRVPGRRKTDRLDCEWIQQLYSCGLLEGCFRPAQAVRQLRTLVRSQARLSAQASDWILRMQKSLDQMNVRVHRAVSDLDGVTGMAILRAIVNGERDPVKLAKLRDKRCKHSEEQIAEQLSGHWQEDHLFDLGQSLKMYDQTQTQIQEYQEEILQRLHKMEKEGYRDQSAPALKDSAKQKALKRNDQEQLRQALYQMSGADLVSTNGLGVGVAQIVLSEYGPDLSRFADEHHFVSHLGLAPRQAISGGKPLRKKKPHSASSRTAAALRMAAASLRRSPSALGAYYRRVARKVSRDVAVFATARKLATLIYRHLRWGKPYVDEGAEAYEKRYQELSIAKLGAAAKSHGFQLVPITETSA